MRSATIFNFLIEANLMASIAILLMIPLRKLLRKQMGNTAICYGWLLIALRLLIPLTLPNPLIHEIRPAYLDDTVIRPIAGQIKVRVVDAIGDLGRVFWQAGNRQAYADMQKVAVGVDYNGYPAVLAWIWAAVCGLILLWFIYKNVKFRKALRDNRIGEISGELKELYLQLCRERKVKPVPVYFTDPVPGACLVGVFRPYIVLPLITAPQDVKNVLTHEVCHLQNKDHLWGILPLFCCAIHWFNPLVWIAASMSRTDSELRCDDRVTGPMNESERKEYANVLVLAAARKSMPGLGVMATGMTMTGKRLKNRVLTVLSDQQANRWLAVSFAVLASLCLIAAFCTRETMSLQTPFTDDTGAMRTISSHDQREKPADMAAYERNIWALAGYNPTDSQSAGAQKDQHCTFDDDGTLLELQDEVVPWLSMNLNSSRKYVRDEETLQQISDRLVNFLETVNPGMSKTIREMQVDWEQELDGQIWIRINGIPKDERDGWITFVVRLEPDWQIQYFSCVTNG